MISLHSFFVILWIFPTITNQLPTYSSKESVIDWSGCGVGTACFCLDDANKLVEANVIQKASDSTPEADIGRCNIGVQNKYFTDHLAVLQLQMIGDNYDLGSDPQLALYIGTRMLFGCKFDSKLKKYERIADSEVLKKSKISLFEDRTRFQAGNVICALKLDRAEKLRSWIMEQRNLLAEKETLKLSSTRPVEYHFYANGGAFLVSKRRNCDPFAFNKYLSSMDYHVQPLINIDRDILNCEDYKSSSYVMRYANSSRQDIQIKSVECVFIYLKGLSYQIVDENGDKELVAEPDQYSFYCAASIDEVCRNPISNCSRLEICPTFLPGSKGVPAQLTCPGKKWIINGEYLELEVEPVCKRDSMNKDEVAFHSVLHSRYEEKISNARCFNEYDCYKKSKLHYSDCKEEKKCGEIDYSDGIMKCKDPKKQLSIYFPTSNETLSASNYTCDKSSGKWMDDRGASLPDNTRVDCPGEPILPAPQVDMSTGQMVWSIVGVFAGSIFLAVVISLVVYCYYFTPKIFVEKGRKGWLKTKKAERIAYCKDLFGKVIQTTVGTNYHIVHGFNQLDLMLDTETFDPEIWEDVYPFLMRFQGTIERLDHNMSKMFMRYMFLQAKKIIDKHGWLCEKPITKETKDRKALMRSVAIRLLSFSINYRHEEEAERFALSGFRKLGFKAEEQYPHCGEMWALMCHIRILGSCKIMKDSRIRLFDREKFAEEIKKIAFTGACDMPDEEVIPEFGSPSDQAAFALGGAPNVNFHQRVVNDEWNRKDTKSTSREKYFDGMGNSLCRNPSNSIIFAFNMTSDVNKQFLENLPNIVNKSEWNNITEKIMKIMVYYGRPLDAKRLQVRFMPAVPQPSELYSQVRMDQQLFEEAAERQMDELRKWFAVRTDKEEIKKAPVYVKDEQIEAAVYARMQKSRTKVEPKAADAEPVAAVDAAASPASSASATPELKP